jgi:hypothetical protein
VKTNAITFAFHRTRFALKKLSGGYRSQFPNGDGFRLIE